MIRQDLVEPLCPTKPGVGQDLSLVLESSMATLNGQSNGKS